METIWHVDLTSEADTYQFTFEPLGAAGRVEIRSAAGGDPIEVENGRPVATQNSFFQHLPPGDYTISWNWMEGRPDVRQAVDFTVDGCAMWSGIQIPNET